MGLALKPLGLLHRAQGAIKGQYRFVFRKGQYRLIALGCRTHLDGAGQVLPKLGQGVGGVEPLVFNPLLDLCFAVLGEAFRAVSLLDPFDQLFHKFKRHLAVYYHSYGITYKNLIVWPPGRQVFQTVGMGFRKVVTVLFPEIFRNELACWKIQ